MNVIIKKREEANISYEQIVDLMHASFEERLQQGLNFQCSSMTVDEFKKNTESSTILVAIDSDSGMFLGFDVVTIKENRKYVKYAVIQDLSISPKVKRCGVGSLLLKEGLRLVNTAGCKYIMSTTAVDAESSVKFHLKQGYKIIGLDSFPTTNYYSYIFRLYLQPSIWQNFLFCRMKYVVSYLKTHLTKKKNGSFTLFGSVLRKCRL